MPDRRTKKETIIGTDRRSEPSNNQPALIKQIGVGVLTACIIGTMFFMVKIPQIYAEKSELEAQKKACNKSGVAVLEKLDAMHRDIRTIELNQRDHGKDIEHLGQDLREEIVRSKEVDKKQSEAIDTLK